MILKELSVKFGLDGVMGYFRPMNCANIGKQQEMKDRVYFSQSIALEHCGCNGEE